MGGGPQTAGAALLGKAWGHGQGGTSQLAGVSRGGVIPPQFGTALFDLFTQMHSQGQQHISHGDAEHMVLQANRHAARLAVRVVVREGAGLRAYGCVVTCYAAGLQHQTDS